MTWVTSRVHGYWLVEYRTDEQRRIPPIDRFVKRRDGETLRFWNEASAKVKACALNRRGIRP